jgi:hypothetical protein
MLSFQLLKNHAGLLLVGDYTSLRCLHEVVHQVNDRSPLIKEEDGPFLGLAFDVRKAYELQREVLPAPEHYAEVGTRYGVQILWPVLLVQQRMLRISLAYLDHSRWHQAATYALEAVIEDALKEDFGTQAQNVIDYWQRIDPTHPSTFEKLDSRAAIFCSWTKAERKRRFSMLLSSFDPMFESHHRIRAERGEWGLLSPEELDRWANVEWPDPRW